jgi:cysteine-rich secretory family protein
MPHLLHRPRLPHLLAVLGATVALLGPVSTATGSPHTGAAPAALPPAAGSVTLDAWGGLHPSAGVPLDTTGAPYWHGWDIARSLQLLPAGGGGWVLDGWGGIHSFGSAPALPAGPYWPHWDIARGLAVHYSPLGRPDGGWVLDGWGGIHSFGAAPALASHAVPGVDVWLHLHPVAGGGAYLAGRWGLVEGTGTPAGIGFDGMPDWGGWDIVRDVVPVAPGLAPGAQPFRPAAAAALMAALQSRDRIDRGRGAVSEDGALDAVAGGAGGYNLAGCGGPAVTIPSRSLDLLQRDYFSHSVAGCAQGQQVFTTYLGSLSWSSAGENIAWASGTASLVDDIVQINGLWLTSPGHLANIVNPAFTRVGCGAAFTPTGRYQGTWGPLFVWTCVFTG